MRKGFDNPIQHPAPEGVRVPAKFRIGGVDIAPATVLAPMAGVTDTVFRRFIRNLGGCGLMMTEFTSADGIVRMRETKAKHYLTFYGNEHPISAQLFGSDPVRWPMRPAWCRTSVSTWSISTSAARRREW